MPRGSRACSLSDETLPLDLTRRVARRAPARARAILERFAGVIDSLAKALRHEGRSSVWLVLKGQIRRSSKLTQESARTLRRSRRAARQAQAQTRRFDPRRAASHPNVGRKSPMLAAEPTCVEGNSIAAWPMSRKARAMLSRASPVGRKLRLPGPDSTASQHAVLHVVRSIADAGRAGAPGGDRPVREQAQMMDRQ